MLKRVYALVLLMLIGVAAFNLVATLIMVVMEKRKDIAVLMAMGATPREVRRIFVLKGLIVGAFGTAAGLSLGGLGCFILSHYHFIHIQKEIYGMSTLPIAVQPLSFALVAVASMILCLIATFYPARRPRTPSGRSLPLLAINPMNNSVQAISRFRGLTARLSSIAKPGRLNHKVSRLAPLSMATTIGHAIKLFLSVVIQVIVPQRRILLLLFPMRFHCPLKAL